ncbi:hypothetical protein Rt10032_c03g1235 [Rhodotorula toruloides]|uniref:Uncharacterized protein n=1 Tax=Rhodotorula toruloides TaxID=5286 RepID=A0A511KA30_RHOTO|nr:hypothetical protein Rt10032_c03g1235 [Rhodotorula toruloides]
MSSDAASTYSFSSTAPLTGAGSSPKSPSLLSKLLRRSTSPSSKPARSASPRKSADTFREIMALNALHGDPSVQAYSLKTNPKTKSPKPAKPASLPLARFSSSSPTSAPKRDAFADIMTLNAKHGDPSVQAYFVR